MIERVPPVAVLVWAAIVIVPAMWFVAFALALVAVVAFTVLIVVKSADDRVRYTEESHRLRLRDAAQRAEIGEQRRHAADWRWPR